MQPGIEIDRLAPIFDKYGSQYRTHPFDPLRSQATQDDARLDHGIGQGPSLDLEHGSAIPLADGRTLSHSH
ncbi:MAG TPA: hypothetical protein VGR09_08995 [Gemmatimonadales bacterium]|nr:hypothetical protein [Gemmatimonadales bacterium]